MMLFKGSGVALITPFDEMLEVNYEALEKLIIWHIEMGTDALVICGTTAESATLTLEEKKQILAFSMKVAKHQIPIIAGTGSNNTKQSIELSAYAKSIDVDGLLLVTPYYNKPTQRGLIAHYKEIANAVDLPIILYNVPSRTGVNLEVSTVVELSKVSNIVAIKEASHDLVQIKKIIDETDDSFTVYSGNDDQTEDIIKMGGKGVISVTANILPKEIHEIAHQIYQGKELSEINDVMFIESNPVPVKQALNFLGFKVGSVRLPLVELTKENESILIETLQKFGLKESQYENFN
ncbi:MAG: 4-hydroxy-tetrahydrodipicolinate synthase [Acholeplasmataceae bacterium]